MQVRIAKIKGELNGPLPADLSTIDNLTEIVELKLSPDGETVSERVIKPANMETDENG